MSAFQSIVAGIACLLALIVPFRGRDVTSLLLCFGLLLLGLEAFIGARVLQASSPADALAWQTWAALPASLIPSVWLLFSLKFSRGNPERFLARWALPILVLFIIPVGGVFLLQDQVVLAVVEIPNTPAHWQFRLGLAGFLLQLSLLVGSAAILMNLERTFRAAVGTMRWRIKYFVLGTAVLFVARIYTSSQALIFTAISPQWAFVTSTALLIAAVFFVINLFRPDSLRVQVYPSERMLQVSITTVLVGGYLVIIGLVSKALRDWGGPDAFAFKALLFLFSLTGFAVLLLSDRLREGTRRFISRHLRRPLYDYRSVWLSFTESTASVMEARPLSRILVEWISQNLHVLSASAWIIDPDQQRIEIAASTGLTGNKAPELSNADAEKIIEGLQSHSYPFVVTDDVGPWVQPLKTCYPDIFHEKGGHRLCVPMVSNARTIGFVTLGDRVNGISYGPQELDLLKCVADQVASNLLNLQLSQRLLQAREMEAFQTIAAFFVHDLKNTASSLNLTLQNLPHHWDNPEFRQDALRAISKSVTHIQDLIKRLTLFRQKLEIHPAEVDLNHIIKSAVAALGPTAKVEQELLPVPRLAADPSQLEKVFTNLFLNAREAAGPSGTVRVDTSRQNGWVVASVWDNGCGMSPEFIGRNLFRPFQTTKQGGIGIGMYQSKTIVEAHGGKIEVTSEPGQGTTFRVLLPLAQTHGLGQD